jgi:hypothetical protein
LLLCFELEQFGQSLVFELERGYLFKMCGLVYLILGSEHIADDLFIFAALFFELVVG